MIKVGDKLPDFTFMTPGADGPEGVTTADLFGGKKAVLFAVPGAFTPTCDQNHLPGYLEHLDALKAKGVDLVACLATNDVFVVGAWAKSTGAEGKLTMLADGSAKFVNEIGLGLDMTERGLGLRAQRFAMILEDGVVKALMVEDTPATADASGAASVLAQL